MLWNWYTVDTCFLAETWHNKTKGAFAGSVIGVFLLVIAIEGLRRLAREYDRKLVKAAMAAAGGDGVSTPVNEDGKNLSVAEGQYRPPFEYVPCSYSSCTCYYVKRRTDANSHLLQVHPVLGPAARPSLCLRDPVHGLFPRVRPHSSPTYSSSRPNNSSQRYPKLTSL